MSQRADATKKFTGLRRLDPQGIRRGTSAANLIDSTFLAYNGSRLREGAHLFVDKMLANDGLVGMSLTGAMTPAGLGKSCLIPLIKAGFIDWMVSTGANLYHDLHYGLDMELYSGSPFMDDVELHRNGVIRIYDVLFDYEVLLDTDAFVREAIQGPEFQRPLGTDEFHYLLGKFVDRRAKTLGLKDHSLLATAYRYGVPIFTSSPGDSSIGMNVAAMELRESQLTFDVNRDVNQTAAIVYHGKTQKLMSSVFIVGGGSPKNFMLQTEPHLQEIMAVPDSGHDYFLQCTDARPDTGGLSGATPAEAVSWGKLDPLNLPDSVVAYVDSTIALPLITAYAMDRAKRRTPKRLYQHRDQQLKLLTDRYLELGSVGKVASNRGTITRSRAARRAERKKARTKRTR